MSAERIPWRADDPETEAVPVGGRPVHALWLQIKPSFRRVFLEPHRRAGAGTVSWRWAGAEAPRLPEHADLADLRERLKHALLDLTADVERRESDPTSTGPRELLAAIKTIVQQLLEGSDEDLGTYAIENDAGWFIRSWGFSRPAQAKQEVATDQAEDAEETEEAEADTAEKPAGEEPPAAVSTEAKPPHPKTSKRGRWVAAGVVVTGAIGAFFWTKGCTRQTPVAGQHPETPTAHSEHTVSQTTASTFKSQHPHAAPENGHPTDAHSAPAHDGGGTLSAPALAASHALAATAASPAHPLGAGSLAHGPGESDSAQAPVPGALTGVMPVLPERPDDPAGDSSKVKATPEPIPSLAGPGGADAADPASAQAASATGTPSPTPAGAGTASASSGTPPHGAGAPAPAGGSHPAEPSPAVPPPPTPKPATTLKAEPIPALPEQPAPLPVNPLPVPSEAPPVPASPSAPTPEPATPPHAQPDHATPPSPSPTPPTPTDTPTTVRFNKTPPRPSAPTTAPNPPSAASPETAAPVTDTTTNTATTPTPETSTPAADSPAASDAAGTAASSDSAPGSATGTPKSPKKAPVVAVKDRIDQRTTSSYQIGEVKARPVRDAVLPTLPTENTGSPLLSEASARAWNQTQATKPQSFRAPVVRGGWSFQRAPGITWEKPPRWLDATTEKPVEGVTVSADGMHLNWAGLIPASGFTARLVGEDGRERARLKVLVKERRLEVTTCAELEDSAPEFTVLLTTHDAAPGVLSWHSRTPTWSDSRWATQRAARQISVRCLPVPDNLTEPSSGVVGLVHAASGWALTWEVATRPALPATTP